MNEIKQIPVTNDGESTMYVGGLAIPAGETRLIDERLVPPEYKEAELLAADTAETDPLEALIALSVAKLVLGLPALTDEELVRLEALENAKEKPRAGALAEITAEMLRRADATLPGNPVAENAPATSAAQEGAAAADGTGAQ